MLGSRALFGAGSVLIHVQTGGGGLAVLSVPLFVHLVGWRSKKSIPFRNLLCLSKSSCLVTEELLARGVDEQLWRCHAIPQPVTLTAVAPHAGPGEGQLRSHLPYNNLEPCQWKFIWWRKLVEGC